MAKQTLNSRVLWIVAYALLTLPAEALAQHVASVYLDAVGDLSTVYTIVNTGDGSSDCEHSGHATGAWLNGPTGYSGSTQSGFSHGVSLPVADGEFTEGGYLEFICGCNGGYTSPPATQYLSFYTTWYGNATGGGGGGCIYENADCTSGTPTCDESPLLVSGAPEPCANYRKALYMKINAGSCRGLGSQGWAAQPNRACS